MILSYRAGRYGRLDTLNSKIRLLVIILWQAEEGGGECVGHPITTVPKWNLALAAAERPYTPLN